MNLPKYTIIKYIRNRKKVPYGVLVAVKNPEGYNIGYSLCSKHDRFEKSMALRIAIGRANFSSQSILDDQNIPRDIIKAIPDFVNRCERYYKPGFVDVNT